MTPKESKQELAALIQDVKSVRKNIARTVDSGAVSSMAENYLISADEKLADALTNLEFAFHLTR